MCKWYIPIMIIVLASLFYSSSYTSQAKSSVFTIKTYIKNDKSTGTFYFSPSHPSCIPLSYKKATVTIKNEAGVGVDAYSFGYLKTNQSATLTISIAGKLYDTTFALNETSPNAKFGFVEIMTCGA